MSLMIKYECKKCGAFSYNKEDVLVNYFCINCNVKISTPKFYKPKEEDVIGEFEEFGEEVQEIIKAMHERIRVSSLESLRKSLFESLEWAYKVGYRDGKKSQTLERLAR